jgi:Tol biopolymer transport system component
MLRLFVLAAVFFAGITAAPAGAPDNIGVLIADHGGRVDWGVNDMIAFDRQDKNGWFQVWTMKPDGTGKRCVTCGKEFPRLHKGNPAWHPSGKYIVFQALDDTIKVPRLWGKLYRVYTGPGAGVNNNIWIASANGKRAWQMTVLGKGKGVLHPHFSHDGKTLVWAEMTNAKPAPFGSWVIRKASFIERRDGPALTGVETLTPGGLQFYETHSFTPDDKALVFTGKERDTKGHALDIYRYDFASGKLAVLTDPKLDEWDEHAQVSPDGAKILWMSSVGIRPNTKGPFVKTDYWLMNIDGTDKQRITRFNDRSSPEYLPGKVVCADSSWSPDGRKFIAYVEHNTTAAKAGHIVVRKVE